MDPNLFYVNWERLFEVLVAIIVAAFLMECALSIVFENRLYINKLKDKGLKEFISFALGIVIALFWEIDAFSMIFLKESVTIPGMVITGAIIAGGSKGSVKLFRDLMKIRSTVEDTRLGEIEAEKKRRGIA